MLSWNFLSASINFLCGHSTFHQFPFGCGTYCQVSVLPRDLPSLSVAFACCREAIRQILSTFRVATGPFVNFCQHSMLLQDLSSASVSFPCRRGPFHQLPSHFCTDAGPFVNFCRFPCCQWTFRQLFVQSRYFLLTFLAVMELSVNFHLLSIRLWYHPSTFINFPFGSGNFRQLLSTFRAATGPSVNFSCSR